MRALASAAEPTDERPVVLTNEELGLAYWAAASWAAWISLSKQQPDVVADLPKAVALARLAYAQSPGQGAGALASLMGTLEASRPGGSMAAAEAYFAQALKSAGGEAPAVRVAMAEALAQPAGDRARFEALLQQALRDASGSQDAGPGDACPRALAAAVRGRPVLSLSDWIPTSPRAATA